MSKKMFKFRRLAKAEGLPCRFRLSHLAAVALLLALPGSVVSQRLPPSARVAPHGEWFALQRPPQVELAEQESLRGALAALKPQRPNVVDAYVVVAALNSDPVFGREAREAGRVLSRRFDAEGRTIVLADGEGEDQPAAPGSPDALTQALQRVGQLADRQQDVVIVYTTSHGSAEGGLEYRDQQRGFGRIRPERLATMLEGSGMTNRLVILSACYSGVFIPRLASGTSVVITAAASDRPSFGCSPGNDWTYFGDAFVNREMRKPQPLGAAFAEARRLVSQWEARTRLPNSNPQMSVGTEAARWLAPLERRSPARPTRPVGRSPADGGAR
ncbi:MAG TPA: C13 family peptidase [Allosphingosinicella sp.]|nr:C13 family peptidase [Allosphingosinicella sp.]